MIGKDGLAGYLENVDSILGWNLTNMAPHAHMCILVMHTQHSKCMDLIPVFPSARRYQTSRNIDLGSDKNGVIPLYDSTYQ